MDSGRKKLMTFQCEQCNTVLGDSHGVCGEMKCLDSILCSKLTHNVTVSDEVASGLEGEMAHCVCSNLKCIGCHCVVGVVVNSTPQHLDVLRSVFLLYKTSISCYILNSKRTVTASKPTFDFELLRTTIDNLKQQVEALSVRVSLIRKRLSESSTSLCD